MNLEYFIVEKYKSKILLGNLLVVPKDYSTGYLAPLSLFSESDLVTKTKNWEKILSNIIRNIESNYKIDDYVIDNCHEIFNIVNDEFDNRPVIKALRKIFKNTGILDRVYFSDNNLDLKNIEGMPNRPHPYFLGWNGDKSVTIGRSRYFHKKFLFMNRIDKFHRRWLLGRFISDELLPEMYWSYNVNNPDAYIHKVLGKSERETGSEEVTYVPHDFMTECFCHIICETNFNLSSQDTKAEGGYTGGNRFITEKTEKAFTTASPFIIASGPRYLEKLHELGFKTFNDWWDESYDKISNPKKRLEAILNVVKYINTKSYEELIDMWQEMKPVLKHNQDLNSWHYIQNLNSINTRFPGHFMANVEGLYFNPSGNETNPGEIFRNYKTL